MFSTPSFSLINFFLEDRRENKLPFFLFYEMGKEEKVEMEIVIVLACLLQPLSIAFYGYVYCEGHFFHGKSPRKHAHSSLPTHKKTDQYICSLAPLKRKTCGNYFELVRNFSWHQSIMTLDMIITGCLISYHLGCHDKVTKKNACRPRVIAQKWIYGSHLEKHITSWVIILS